MDITIAAIALNHPFTTSQNTCQGKGFKTKSRLPRHSAVNDAVFWKIHHLGLLLPHLYCWDVQQPFLHLWRGGGCSEDMPLSPPASSVPKWAWALANSGGLDMVVCLSSWFDLEVGFLFPISNHFQHLPWASMGFRKLVRRFHSRVLSEAFPDSPRSPMPSVWKPPSPSCLWGLPASCVSHQSLGHSHLTQFSPPFEGPFPAPSQMGSWFLVSSPIGTSFFGGASLRACWNKLRA